MLAEAGFSESHIYWENDEGMLTTTSTALGNVKKTHRVMRVGFVTLLL